MRALRWIGRGRKNGSRKIGGSEFRKNHRTLYWRIRTHRAARRADWKLVRIGNTAPQLFNLRTEIGETRNLAAAEPALTSELSASLAAWEADVDRVSAG